MIPIFYERTSLQTLFDLLIMAKQQSDLHEIDLTQNEKTTLDLLIIQLTPYVNIGKNIKQE